MNLEKNQIFLYKIILCVISWITIFFLIGSSLLTETPLENIGWVVSSYSFQSNFLVFLWITCDVIYEALKKEKPFFLRSITHGAITVYITVTFVIFALILQPLIGFEYMFDITNLLCHYIVPCLVIVEWVLTQKDDEYERKYALYWLIFPYIYLAYSMILELTTGVNFYFFISINLFGPLVIVSVALLTVLFYGLSRLLFFINERK